MNDTTSEDLQSLSTLVPMGLRVALKEVYQRFRWSVPAAGEECLGTSPQSTVPSPQSGDANAEGRMQKEENIEDKNDSQNPDARKSYIVNRKSTEGEKTPAAQTSDDTPIAAGADPARNPGLLSPQSRVRSPQLASRQMPDTQVDAGDFWSRAGLAPRGADGQTLPMPSLGYAVPNIVSHNLSDAETLKERLKDLKDRGLGHCRAAQALQAEINRREQQAKTQSASLANAGFNSKEPRDRYGKWTTGSNAGGSGTNGASNKLTLTPEEIRRGAQTMPWQQFHGTEADYIALHPNDPFYRSVPHTDLQERLPTAAEVGQVFGTMGRMLTGGLADFGETITGHPTRENLEAAIEGTPMPMVAESRFLPAPLRIVERGSQGLVESAPKIAAVAGLQAAGVPAPVSAAAVFGTTEQGFDLKQALIAAALPMLGKYTGSLTEAIATKAGVSSEAALQALNKMGGAAGAASLIGADQLQEIMKLPPEKRKDALIEAAAAAGSIFLLQTLGEGKRSETEKTGGKSPIKKGEITTYEDFKDRSLKGDDLQGHETWQHANLKAHGLATERLSTEASKQNPVIALDGETHAKVNIAQRSIDAPLQTPAQNISANAKILRKLGAAEDKVIDDLEQKSKQHSEKYKKS